MYALECEPTSTTIEAVKETLQGCLRKERNVDLCFDLIYKERVLKDQETIAQSGIQPDERIVAVQRKEAEIKSQAQSQEALEEEKKEVKQNEP